MQDKVAQLHFTNEHACTHCTNRQALLIVLTTQGVSCNSNGAGKYRKGREVMHPTP